MYSDKVIDHFQNPRNVGEIEDASGVGTVGNAKCGDMMRLYLKIGWTSAGKRTLFFACRRNTACSFVGLCRKAWNQDSGTCKAGTGY